MLSEDQIQQAHDMLQSVSLNPKLLILIGADAPRRAMMFAIMETLCWVLEHDRGRTVTEVLAELREDLHKIGLSPVPMVEPS